MQPSNLEVGISAAHFEWETLAQAFSRAREFGLQRIEFSTHEVGEHDYATCARLAAETGVRPSLHGWSDLAEPRPREAVEELRYLLEVCRQMTATHLVMHLGSHPQRAIGLERVAQVCRAVAHEYEQAGITLCLENHYPYEYHGLNELGGEPEDFDLVFALTQSPAVRFCLDYGHSHMSGNTAEFIARLGPYLAYTHIADNLGENDDHLGPDDGTIDWPEVFGLTLRTGFTGPYVIEFPEQGDPGRFARCMQLLHQARG